MNCYLQYILLDIFPLNISIIIKEYLSFFLLFFTYKLNLKTKNIVISRVIFYESIALKYTKLTADSPRNFEGLHLRAPERCSFYLPEVNSRTKMGKRRRLKAFKVILEFYGLASLKNC